MEIKLTKKESEEEDNEKVVQSEDFIDLCLKFNKNTEQIKELPRTETNK